MKKKILVFINYFTPSIKGGGPVQSVRNLVDNLHDKFEFYIITSDRELGEKKPYQNIEIEKWANIGNAKVFYINPKRLSLFYLKKIIDQINADLIYLNSFFSYRFSISVLILHKLNLINDIRIVLAPRGEFSKGALRFKTLKKSIYIFLSKVIGLYSKISWHATASTEKEDIKRVFSDRNQIFIANNMTANHKSVEHYNLRHKLPGQLRVIFLSRIHPKKNLKTAIELLTNVKGKVEFDIYGPIEDDKYWDKCKRLIQQLPSNIVVNYNGLVANNDVVTIFNKYHVFLFPTLGENFGHVISEALIGGCILITSNQTPWLNLEDEKVGWDIPLEKAADFSKAIQTCINMNNLEYSEYSLNAYNFGMNKSTDIKIKDAYINMFCDNCKM